MKIGTTLFCFSMLIFNCIGAVYADREFEVSGIRSVINMGFGKISNIVPELKNISEIIFSVEERFESNERSFRINFELPKGTMDLMPETLELLLLDNNGKEHGRQIRNFNGNVRGTKICNAIESTSMEGYRCFIIDYLHPDENISMYNRFIVAVRNDGGKELMRFEGEKPRLTMVIDPSPLSKLIVLTNFYSEAMKITDVANGEYIRLKKSELTSSSDELVETIIPSGGGCRVKVELADSINEASGNNIKDNFKLYYKIGDIDYDTEAIFSISNIPELNLYKSTLYHAKENMVELENKLKQSEAQGRKYFVVAIAAVVVTTTAVILIIKFLKPIINYNIFYQQNNFNNINLIKKHIEESYSGEK